MDAVIDLTILVVVLLIAFKMMRWDGPLCVNCDVPAAEARLYPVRKDRAAPAGETPGNVFFFDYPDRATSVSNRKPPASLSPASDELIEKPVIAQDELILDSDPDGMYSLLSPDLEAEVPEEAADDELILEEEIGLGTVGASMASQLVQAGFAVTIAPQKWRRDSKRLDLTGLDDFDNC